MYNFINYKDGDFNNSSLENMEIVSLDDFLKQNGFKEIKKSFVVEGDNDKVSVYVEDDDKQKTYTLDNNMALSKNLHDLLTKDFGMKEVKQESVPAVRIEETDEFPLVIRISQNGYTIDYLDQDTFSEEYLAWCLNDFEKEYNEFSNKIELRCTISQQEEMPCLGCSYGFMELFPTGLVNQHMARVPAFDNQLICYVEYILEVDKNDTKQMGDFLDWIASTYGRDVDLQINGYFYSIDDNQFDIKPRKQSYPVWFIDGQECVAL